MSKIKKIISFILAASMSVSMLGITQASETTETIILKIGESRAVVNGNATVIDEDLSVVPVIDNERTFVPLRFISENFGAEVTYSHETQKIEIKKDEISISLTIGKPEIIVNGKTQQMDVSPYIIAERTMFPLRFIAEALEKDIEWYNAGIVRSK